MITPEVLQALAARRALVYRVNRPAFVARVGGLSVPVPASAEHFTSFLGAVKHAADHDAATLAAGSDGVCTIDPRPAAELVECTKH